MIFNSLTYMLFLVLVIPLYWALPNRGRQWFILVVSCIFYGFWRFDFLPLLLFSAVMDYVLARLIDRTQDEKKRFRMLVISIVANLSILVFFKYLIFFRDTAFSIAELVGYHPSFVEMKIILPLGISFYIFATIGYVIDVYRREFPAEKDLLVYCCFVVYFPHLVAGPILRASSLIPQLRDRARFEIGLLPDGIARIVAGLFLKVCLADPIGAIVDEGFARDPWSLSGLDAWTLAFLFGFQIYFDFAGYSHIAIGSSKLMGITLPENFNYPYSASSPREFWRRWHISLSTWIRDYVYLPMAGSYRRRERVEIADHASAPAPGLPREQRTLPLFATWALMGLWHGANWTFVVWGLYHAVAIYVHRRLAPLAERLGVKLPVFLGWGVTLAAMMASWIAFRAQTLGQLWAMWSAMVNPHRLIGLTLLPTSYIVAAATLVAVMLSAFLSGYVPQRLKEWSWPFLAVNWVYYSVAFGGVIVFLRVATQFIYFQF